MQARYNAKTKNTEVQLSKPEVACLEKAAAICEFVGNNGYPALADVSKLLAQVAEEHAKQAAEA